MFPALALALCAALRLTALALVEPILTLSARRKRNLVGSLLTPAWQTYVSQLKPYFLLLHIVLSFNSLVPQTCLYFPHLQNSLSVL